MKIPARRAIKATALAAYRPLKPLLDAVGFDAKAAYEMAYWRSRQIEEGMLANDWYEKTSPYGSISTARSMPANGFWTSAVVRVAVWNGRTTRSSGSVWTLLSTTIARSASSGTR